MPAPTAQPTLGQQADATSDYRANMRRMLREDSSFNRLFEGQYVDGNTKVIMTVPPNGQVIRETYVSDGYDKATGDAIMNALAQRNFGAFTADMPDHPTQFVLPIENN